MVSVLPCTSHHLLNLLQNHADYSLHPVS